MTSTVSTNSIPADSIVRPHVCTDGTLNYTPTYVNIVAAVVSVLSMVGSVLIVLSYACFKRMRTKGREILLHLSLMDFVVGFANFFGSVVDFDSLLLESDNENATVFWTRKGPYKIVCVAQGAVALFSNTSSILWTIAIAVHIYLSLMTTYSKVAGRCYWIVCYGLSLLVTVWFVGTEKLGPSPLAGSWCSIKTSTGSSNSVPYFNVLFGSNLWVYLTIIVVPALSVSLIVHYRLLVPEWQMKSMVKTIRAVESKLLVIPIIFILLRVWSLLLVELQLRRTLPCPVILLLLFLGCIGDSGQGFFNALIYCLFNRNVRQAYLDVCSYYINKLLCCKKNYKPLLSFSSKKAIQEL